MDTDTPIHGWIEVFPAQALGARQVGSYTEPAEVARPRECMNDRGRRPNSCSGKTSDGVLPVSGSQRTGAACSSAWRSWRGGWACGGYRAKPPTSYWPPNRWRRSERAISGPLRPELGWPDLPLGRSRARSPPEREGMVRKPPRYGDRMCGVGSSPEPPLLR